MASYSYPLSPDSDTDEEDTCQVYWQTKSILEDHPIPNLPPPPAPAPISRPPIASTPLKPKRNTAAAALPSPSTSSSSTARPARFIKRTRRTTAPPPDASQRVDAGTLKLVSQLQQRFSQRSASPGGMVLREKSGAVNAGGRAGIDKHGSGGAKGKGKAVLQSSEAHARPASTTTLQLASSKASLNPHLTSNALSNLNSTKPSPPPTISRARTAASRPIPIPPPAEPETKDEQQEEEEEDYDSYFDQVDDESLELALSQLEEKAVGAPESSQGNAPPPPPPAPRRATTTAAAPKPQPQSRHVPRVPTNPRQQQPQPPVRSSPRLAAPITRRPLPAAAARRPLPTTTTAAAPPPPQPRLVRGSSSSSIIAGKQGGGKEQQEAVEELARREMELFLAEGGDGGWSEGEEDF